MTDTSVLNLPSWDGPARAVAFVWRLTKGRKHATCELWTRPIDAELRVQAGAEFVRSQAGRDPLALIETAANWKSQFHERGWA